MHSINWHRLTFIFQGPQLYLSCPMGGSLMRVWFTDLWNYSIFPYLMEAIKDGIQVYFICQSSLLLLFTVTAFLHCTCFEVARLLGFFLTRCVHYSCKCFASIWGKPPRNSKLRFSNFCNRGCDKHLCYPGLFEANESSRQSRCLKYFRLTDVGRRGKTRRSGWRRRALGPRRSPNSCIWGPKTSVTTLNSNRPKTLIHSTPPMPAITTTTTTTWIPWSSKLLARFPPIPWLVAFPMNY